MCTERERERKKSSRLGRQARTADRKSILRGFHRHRIGHRLQEVEEKKVVAEEVMEAEGELGAKEVRVVAKEVRVVAALSKVAGRKMKSHCSVECIQGLGFQRGVCASTFYNIFRVISMQNQRA